MRQGPRPMGVAAAVVDDEPANEGGTATAVAPRPVRPTRTAWAAPPRRSSTPAVPRRRFSESIAEYAYVGADLRRIGMLVGGLVVFMVVLSFIIR